MEGAILLAATLGPALLLMALGKTRAWWLPGVALLVTMFFCFSGIEHSESHGSPVDAIGAIGNAIMAGAGIWCGLYGAVALLIGGGMRKRHQRKLAAEAESEPPAPTLPEARALSSQR